MTVESTSADKAKVTYNVSDTGTGLRKVTVKGPNNEADISLSGTSASGSTATTVTLNGGSNSVTVEVYDRASGHSEYMSTRPSPDNDNKASVTRSVTASYANPTLSIADVSTTNLTSCKLRVKYSATAHGNGTVKLQSSTSAVSKATVKAKWQTDQRWMPALTSPRFSRV
jgi:hypothetical protein